MIELNSSFFIALYITIGFFIVYKLLFRKNTIQSEYEQLYKEVITSNKYKVKGQNDSED